MNKKIFLAVLAAVLISSLLYSQDKEKEPAKKEPAKTEPAKKEDQPAGEKPKLTVWQEVVLEDFETTPYTDKNISYNVYSDQEAKVTMRDQLPATSTSKKYLGLKVKTRGGDVVIIRPPKDLIIDKFCKAISFWVYGKKTYGELSFMIQDTKLLNHKLIIVPTVDFLGWKQFTVKLDRRILQEDDFLNQRKIMKIINIQYRTVGMKHKPSQWEYIYLDDITATVRERYDDKQSDEW